MKIGDARTVIEILLCCGDPDEIDGIGDFCLDEERLDLFDPAVALRRDAHRDHPPSAGIEDCYEDDCLEAAYRLIESSPTLRREWFGAR